jgi:hypothetical protein
MASLLDLAQARLQGLLDIPTRATRALVNPTLFSGLLGAPTLPQQQGMAEAAYGLPARQNMSVLDPKQAAYLQGYQQGEPLSYLGMATPFAAPAAVAGAKAVAPKAGMALENYMASQGLLQPIMTYHASPYKFEKFDPSKVGTGEGAQSYGVGAGYVAQNPKVANEYFKAFTDVESIPLMYKGKKVDTPWNDEISQRWADVIEKNKFTQEQVEDFQGVLGNLSQVNTMQDVPNVLRGLSKDQLKIYDKYIKSELTKPETPEAFMYKVDVADEAIPKMLDWDKPLSEQKEVMKLLKRDAKTDPWVKDFLNMDLADEPNMLGKDLYDKLKYRFNEDQALASKYLEDKGLKGIKYLDAFSRKDTPKPTYNFVPFDPEDMKIKETTKGLLE